MTTISTIRWLPLLALVLNLASTAEAQHGADAGKKVIPTRVEVELKTPALSPTTRPGFSVSLYSSITSESVGTLSVRVDGNPVKAQGIDGPIRVAPGTSADRIFGIDALPAGKHTVRVTWSARDLTHLGKVAYKEIAHGETDVVVPGPTCGEFTFTPQPDAFHPDLRGNFQVWLKKFDPRLCNLACDCGKIWFLQVLHPTLLDSGEICHPNPTQQARAIKDPNPLLNGWAVDREETYDLDPNDPSSKTKPKSGYYHLLNDGTPQKTPPFEGVTEFNQIGSRSVDAAAHDGITAGSVWKGKRVRVEGVMIAVCMDESSPCAAHVLGMKQWSLQFGGSTSDVVPKEESLTPAIKQIVDLAVRNWNDHLDGIRVALPQFVFLPQQ